MQELRAYLDLFQYTLYIRYLPRLSTVAMPMYEIEKKGMK